MCAAQVPDGDPLVGAPLVAVCYQDVPAYPAGRTGPGHAESCPPGGAPLVDRDIGQEWGTHRRRRDRGALGCSRQSRPGTFAPEPDSSPRRRHEGTTVFRPSQANLGPGPSHANRRRSRRGLHARSRSRVSMLLRLIPIATAGAVVLGGVAVASAEQAVRYTVAAPVTVQAMGLSTAQPTVGQSTTVGVKLVAEQDQTFEFVVVAVRDGAGRNFDFPGSSSWSLGTSQKVFTSSRTFPASGTYTYWFAYRQAGLWTNLSPRMTFTVAPSGGSPSPTDPAPSPPAPSPTTSPAPSPTTSPSAPTANPKPLGVPGTWTYKFGDEFTGPVAWGSKWADSSSAEADSGHGNLGNQQLEWNHKANCSTADGVVSLTAKPADITSPSGRHYNWSSCLLSSSPSYAFRYGYIEIRAQLPGPKGFWPAFWTWQAAGNNQWTETDVFEFYSDNHSRLYLTQHSGAGGHLTYVAPFDPTTGFHTYGADIAPDGTRFYIDGKLVYTAPGTSTGLTNIIIDNFVYSRIPPAPGTTGVMKVDYVRAWQR